MKRKACSQTIDFSLSDLEDSAPETTSVTVERFSADRRRILQCQQDDIRFASSHPPSTVLSEPQATVYHDLSQLDLGSVGDANRMGKKCHGGRVLLSVCLVHLLLLESQLIFLPG